MMYFCLRIIYARSNQEVCDMNRCRTSQVSQNPVHDRYAYSLARELRTRALQSRRGLLEGRDKIVIHQTSANEATQYTGNWAWTFRIPVTRSSDYYQSRAKRQNA